jgi:Mn2+/Fe2+ NRAMP family transporter
VTPIENNAPNNIPDTFWQYIRSFGPGVVIVLAWLGAGDLVDVAMAGSDYGYTLMWALGFSLLIRYAFVSIIAKYQLCNERRESLMAAFARIHASLPLILGIVVLISGHFFGAYMIKGAGEVTWILLGNTGSPLAWSIVWALVAVGLILGGKYARIEKLFYVFLGMLSLSLVGIALWCRPNPIEIVKGVLLFAVPPDTGSFKPLLIAVSLIGAVAGSINNLLYPYFMQEKGWAGPAYRKVQLYDLLFGILIIIILDIAIWVIGAEVLHPRNLHITSVSDMANLLVLTVGTLGVPIFYLGVFAALFTSMVGLSMGYGLLCWDVMHVYQVRAGKKTDRSSLHVSKTYRAVILWSLISPLVWSAPGMPGFVELTILVNAAAVLVQPLLAGILWYITANSKYIGTIYKNRWWENLMMAFLFVLACYATWQAVLNFIP